MSNLRESKLPDKPSALIRVALGDLQKCMADPIYTIDMRHWHTPADDESYCAVCFAGAVLAQTFKVLPSTLVVDIRRISHLDYSGDAAKLDALDLFRSGDITDGLKTMGLQAADWDLLLDKLPDGPRRFKDTQEGFFADMNTIADALERYGY